MADETPSLHIDTDWKKQAQAEKRKLAEEAAAKEAAAATIPAGSPPVSMESGPSKAGTAGTAVRQAPQASFATLVQQVLTQALYYLGGLASAAGGEPVVNLDMAKLHVDTLGVLEDKTKGNLTPDEQKLLDTALYETRMRFVSVAAQML